jgi:hypothetical protein
MDCRADKLIGHVKISGVNHPFGKACVKPPAAAQVGSSFAVLHIGNIDGAVLINPGSLIFNDHKVPFRGSHAADLNLQGKWQVFPAPFRPMRENRIGIQSTSFVQRRTVGVRVPLRAFLQPPGVRKREQCRFRLSAGI